jgi:hypothetical protein
VVVVLGPFVDRHQRLEHEVVGHRLAARHEQGPEPSGHGGEDDVVDRRLGRLPGGLHVDEPGARPGEPAVGAGRDVQRGARGQQPLVDHGGDRPGDGGGPAGGRPRPEHGVGHRPQDGGHRPGGGAGEELQGVGRGRGLGRGRGRGVGRRAAGDGGRARDGPHHRLGDGHGDRAGPVEVEQHGGEVDAAHAIDDGVVRTLDHPHVPARQPGDEVDVPRGALVVEGRRVHLRRQPAEGVVVAGRRERHVVHVAGDVEAGIVDPVGPVAGEPPGGQALAQPRERTEPARHVRPDGVEAQVAVLVEQGVGLEDGHRPDVHRASGVLEGEEAGFECGQAVTVHDGSSSRRRARRASRALPPRRGPRRGRRRRRRGR